MQGAHCWGIGALLGVGQPVCIIMVWQALFGAGDFVTDAVQSIPINPFQSIPTNFLSEGAS